MIPIAPWAPVRQCKEAVALTRPRTELVRRPRKASPPRTYRTSDFDSGCSAAASNISQDFLYFLFFCPLPSFMDDQHFRIYANVPAAFYRLPYIKCYRQLSYVHCSPRISRGRRHQAFFGFDLVPAAPTCDGSIVSRFRFRVQSQQTILCLPGDNCHRLLGLLDQLRLNLCYCRRPSRKTSTKMTQHVFQSFMFACA